MSTAWWWGERGGAAQRWELYLELWNLSLCLCLVCHCLLKTSEARKKPFDSSRSLLSVFPFYLPTPLRCPADDHDKEMSVIVDVPFVCSLPFCLTHSSSRGIYV